MSESEGYKETAIYSFRLAIELFNRPYDEGRIEAVLLMLNHAFEMLLKGAILQNGGEIRDQDGEGQTYSFETCVNKCRYGDRGNENLVILSESEGAALLVINNQRDFAQHEQVNVNEHQLFLEARQSIDIFERILNEVFDDSLGEYLPERVLPLSTMVPVDIVNVIETEVRDVRDLLDAGDQIRARQRIKAIESLERGLEDEGITPAQSEVDEILEAIEQGQDLERVFPQVFAALTGDMDAGGGVRIRLGNEEGIQAAYVPEEEIDEDTDLRLFTEKNLHDRFPLNPMQAHEKINEQLDEEITWPKCKAVMEEIGLREDRELYRPDISLGHGDSRQGYHLDAVEEVVRAVKAGIDPEEAWEEHKHAIPA